MATETMDVTKLPKKWQSYIAKLERDVADYQSRLAAGPEDSNTFADPYFSETTRPLGKDTLVRFQMDDYDEGNRGYENYIECRIGRNHKGGSFVEMRSGRSLVIEPSSSNVIRARVQR